MTSVDPVLRSIVGPVALRSSCEFASVVCRPSLQGLESECPSKHLKQSQDCMVRRSGSPAVSLQPNAQQMSSSPRMGLRCVSEQAKCVV
eukprot:TRINITY_DN43381_c0_g1_i1.p2 TRINITY_DN43381_c0_g1~~TRINITY_DN43381_c0_g1_i1.p2  ORF type:complete len:100 (-),score=1.02 TRINITY_DN43381_c0_g1_i1:188-454(-)